MTEIKTEQKLEVNHILSFRGKVKQSELESIGKDMENQIVKAGAKRIGNPILATYSMDRDCAEVEILLPINQRIENTGNYHYKEKLKIVHAAMLSYKGSPLELQNACNELNEYIIKEQMQPITAGYNVTKRIDPLDANNTEIDVYVGISPNIV